jgi:hypothetical protein
MCDLFNGSRQYIHTQAARVIVGELPKSENLGFTCGGRTLNVKYLGILNANLKRQMH